MYRKLGLSDTHLGMIILYTAFNLSLVLQNSDSPDILNTLTLHDVKIENWVYSMPEDDFLLESVDFQALYISVREE